SARAPSPPEGWGEGASPRVVTGDVLRGDSAPLTSTLSAQKREEGAQAQCQGKRTLSVCGVSLVADLASAIYWPEEGALIVADLHLEKGSSFARRGMLLPPYDTATTLALLGRVIARHAPRLVIALGDSFHDGGGPARVMLQDRATLASLQRGR